MHEQVHGNDAAPVVKPESLLDLLQQVDPVSLGKAARGLAALLAAFDDLNDDKSLMAAFFSRMGLLAKAAYLPDAGTFDIAALQFLMGGCSDDTVRRMAKGNGVAKYQPSGRAMYRSSELARAGLAEPEQAGENASE